ncbi:EAL domain-containing protein [Fusobacterium sp. IOR10]|uniref:two-component system response regulator n=1 Tax=Fusobacterium sp. IOR10 TaxID=2665157 RepID=UPI0013D67928|nr:EAL domain-containing protein [Fusobacterium sp. IOR10]
MVSKKHTILVVDDNEINIKILEKILEKDYNVLSANNGQEALDIIRSENNKIATILLDLVMPVMDGFEFLKIHQRDRVFSSLPVIVMTQQNDVDTEIEALSLGASDFLPKPYNPIIIKHRIKNIIELIQNSLLVNTLEKDSLTNLYTKEAFFGYVEKYLKDSKADFDLIGLNIERFKLVNDIFGMKEGDRLLEFIAKLIEKKFGDYEVVCSRAVADQFYIFINRDADYINILYEIEREIKAYNLNIEISIHFGVYQINNKKVPISIMCDRVKLAIDSIKGKYNMLYSRYDEKLIEKIKAEQELLNCMEESLKNKDFKVYLQPKSNLITGEVVGAEALIRWVHKDLGFITPNRFIPLFEKNGFITNIDMFVLEEVCSKLKNWIDRGVKPIRISINLSRVDIYNPNLIKMMMVIINKYEVPIEYISLEITETSYTENSKQLITVVKNLKKIGFNIEMDDFGSGYSSLNMLEELPIDILKLDIKFLETSSKTKNNIGILNFVVGLGKWLDLSLIVEGVETIEQVNYLKSIGYTYGQGYYFAKPMPKDDFEKYLIENRNKKEILNIGNDFKNKFIPLIEIEEILNPNSQFSKIFESEMSVLSVQEYSNGNLSTIRANKRFFKRMNITSEMIYDKNLNLFKLVHEDDIFETKENLNEVVSTNKGLLTELRLKNLNNLNDYFKIQVRVIPLEITQLKSILLFSYENIEKVI